MAHLIVKSGLALGQLSTFNNELVITRTDGKTPLPSDYMGLDDDMVSRNHCRIYLDKNGYQIQDLGSTNGTCVGTRVLQPSESCPITDGVIVQVGSTQLLFTSLENRQDSKALLDDMDITHSMPQKFEFNDDEATLEVMSDDEVKQDVSMVVDATQFMQDFDRVVPDQLSENEELLRQMQAMIKVSMAVGATTNMDMLISKVMILLFDLFESAERTFVMLYDKANNKFVPLCVRYRDSNIQPKRHVEISETIIRTVIHKKQALLIEDATRDQQYGHQDSVMNLSMHSVMCAPLLYENQVLGLVQVDNRKIHKEFSGKDLQILMAVCAQLSISVKNSSLFQDIEQLFEGFVRASVQAIESRDPSTAGHSFRVAEYTEKLARSVDKSSIAQLKNIKFSHEQIKELRYASLLHDFGKVGVRENVLTKAKKLYGHELKDLKQRVKYAEACIEQQAYKQLIDRHTVQNLSQQQFLAEKKQVEQYIIEQKKDLSRFLNAVLILNEPGDNIDSLQVELEAFQNYKFANHNNNSQMLLEPFEFSALCGMKGSLTTLERKEIESHVTHTNIFLSLIPWTEHLSNLPNIAHAHHERLDGSGYPFGLSTEDIPLQSKIMAIADVYDALTAGDRPYRQGVKSEQALGIIEAEVNAGKLDRILFKIFVESKSFEL